MSRALVRHGAPLLLGAALLALTGCPDPGENDADGDGVSAARDCDDSDPDVGEPQREACNGVDDDCNGLVDDSPPGDPAVGATPYYRDNDDDGYGIEGSTPVIACEAPEEGSWATNADDCDDLFDTVYPGADELCDVLDNDCDGDVDEDAIDPNTFYRDADEDGWGDSETTTQACEPPEGFVSRADDCDDQLATTYPGADELCDELDNDCDDDIDEDPVDARTWYPDEDGDGAGGPGETVEACAVPDGYALTQDDCDDSDPAAFPSNTEICDGIDNDCDVSTDEDGLIALDGVTQSDLESAFAAATDGSTLAICSGTWTLEETVSVNLDVTGPQGADVTVLNASGDGPMLTLGSATTVSVDNLTFQDGAATRGAAIHAPDAADLSISECVFESNLAEEGGAVWAGSTTNVTITDTSFEDNVALDDGGALRAGLLTLTRTTFTANAADRGGALALDGGDATVDPDTLFERNEAITGGGAVAILSANQVSDGEYDSNTTRGDGGAFWLADGASALITQVHDNEASGDGGGVVCVGDCSVEGGTLDGNMATRGGAVALTGAGTASLTGLDMTGNFAADSGGAVLVDATGGTMVIDGSIVNTNEATAGGGASVAAGVLESIGSDWGTGSTENDPDDVAIGSNTYDAYGTSASFECDASAGTCE